MIWACTMTSRAVVGSSASSTFGSQASASAIAARWRMPPENSCGYLRTRSLAGCRPARTARRPAPGRPAWRARPLTRSTSTIWEPIRRTGLNAFIAPWNTMAISVQRALFTLSSPSAMMSVPFSSTSPENSAVGGSSPSRARTVVLLPQPDSPTSPARSAASRVKLTPRTACTRDPSSAREPDVEVTTSSSGSFIRARCAGPDPGKAPGAEVGRAQARVERVLDGPAEQAAGEDDDGDQHTRRHDRPPGALDRWRRAGTRAGSSCPARPGSGRRGRGTRARSRGRPRRRC